MTTPNFTTVSIRRWRDGAWSCQDDPVAEEVFLRICVNGSVYGSLVCSPWALDELVVGYLHTDGVISSCEEIESLSFQGDAALVRLRPAPASSRPPVRGSVRPLTAQGVVGLVRALEESSELFRRTGGVHSAALSDGEHILFSCEDVSRHNALDRLIGRCLLQGVSMEDMVIVFSGRVPDEIIRKVSGVACRAMVSVSAPTSMAIETAREAGITLICFVRQNRFNVYTHPERFICE